MYIMHMKDGSTIEVDNFDGGGIWIGEGARYEVHFYRTDGEFDSVYQGDVAKVVDEKGKIFCDFGNAFFPEHPCGLSLDELQSGTLDLGG